MAHQNGPTERTIRLLIMNMAINLVETLETYKGILETFILRCIKKKRVGVSVSLFNGWGEGGRYTLLKLYLHTEVIQL